MSGGVSVQAQFMDWLDAESGGAGDVSKYYGSAFTRDDELAEHGVPHLVGDTFSPRSLLKVALQRDDVAQQRHHDRVVAGHRSGELIAYFFLRELGAPQDVIDRAEAELHRLGYLPSEGDHGVAQVGASGHNSSPCSARAVTRYVAGALVLVACWQLQGKGWFRRAAFVGGRGRRTPSVGGAA